MSEHHQTVFKRDLLIILVVAVLSYIVFSLFDALEWLVSFSHAHEAFELDELIPTTMIVALCCLLFIYRRWREVQLDKALIASQKSLLEHQVIALNALDNVSTVLKNDTDPVEVVVQQVVEILPSIMKNPEQVCAEIVFDGDLFLAENFSTSKRLMSREIRTVDEKIGEVNLYSTTLESESSLAVESKIVDEIVDRLRVYYRTKMYREFLLKSEKRFRLVMDSLDAVVYVADMESGELLFINRKLAEAHGDVVGKVCWQVLQQGQTGPCSFCTNRQLLKKDGTPGEGCTWEFQNTIDGRWYLINDRAIRWLDGRIVRLEIATDISEHKEVLRKYELESSITAHFAEGVSLVRESDKVVVYANTSLLKMFNFETEDLIGQPATFLFTHEHENPETKFEAISATLHGGEDHKEEIEHVASDGTRFWTHVSSSFFDHWQHGQVWISIHRDISARKTAEGNLRRAHDELEQRVLERTRDLDESNVALKLLLREKEQDKAEIEANLLNNVSGLVEPYLHKLRSSGLNQTQVGYLDLIDSSLHDIVSPFVREISSPHIKLTPAEIQVANLVKIGRSTKEISALLNLSPDTINNHRKSIRKKLGLKRKDDNLRSRLLSLDD